jgi:hypothetical protein
LLTDLKLLKKEYAGGAMYKEDFESRKVELLQGAEENRKEMKREQEKLMRSVRIQDRG